MLYKSKVADLENSFLRDRCGKTGGLGYVWVWSIGFASQLGCGAKRVNQVVG